MTHADSTRTAPADPAGHPDPEDADAKGSIRDRSVREVVERTRDVIRKTRELLDNSRELLDRVRHRDGDRTDDRADGRAENHAPADGDDAPGEHDADEGSDDHAGVDARPVDGRA